MFPNQRWNENRTSKPDNTGGVVGNSEVLLAPLGGGHLGVS